MLEAGHYGPWETRPSPNNPAESKRSHTPDKRTLSCPLPLTKPAAPSELMQKVDDGDAEINAWGEENGKPLADVTFHAMRSSKREYVVVTGAQPE